MKFSFKAQRPLEWLALKLHLLPTPLAHSHLYALVARAVLEANELGIFKALDQQPLTIPELARRCGLDARALASLLTCLAPAGYFEYDGTHVALSRMSRAWLAPSSKQDLDPQLRLNLIGWDWLSHLREFLRTGRGVQYHDSFAENDWRVYQEAMYSGPGVVARAVARRVPMPRRPAAMLDVGGSHGRFSVEMCRRFPSMRAVVLDLPEAVAAAAPILAAQGMGDRVRHQIGNALTDDFGENTYDFILCANLMHHFSASQNVDLASRAARALRPGGHFAILEFIRPPISRRGDQVGGALDLFFSLSSASGTWSLDEMQGWQRHAGLTPHAVQRFFAMPGFANVIARKK